MSIAIIRTLAVGWLSPRHYLRRDGFRLSQSAQASRPSLRLHPSHRASSV